MKSKRSIPVKPRNRESKNRSAHIPPAEECRHLWIDGICMKCGCRREDVVQTEQKSK